MKFKAIIILFSILYVVPSYALNLSEIRTEIRRNIRDSDSANYRYSDATMNSLINQGQKEVVNLTWCTFKSTSYALTALTTYYTLPQDFLAARLVYFRNTQGNTINLSQLGEQSLYDKNPSWDKTSIGSPVSYYVSNATNPVVSSSSSLRISYIPIAPATSTGTVTVWYFNEVSDLISDSDIPFEGRRNLFSYHMAIVYYVTMRLMAIDGINDDVALYQGLYTSQIGIMKQRVFYSPNYNPSFGAGDGR